MMWLVVLFVALLSPVILMTLIGLALVSSLIFLVAVVGLLETLDDDEVVR